MSGMFSEPPPENYREPLWPVYVATAVTFAAATGLVFVVLYWGLLALVPYAGFMAFKVVRAERRHKRWMAEAAAWHDRMCAHYAGLAERRSKAMWS